jgi:hypothetical protein
MLLAILAALFTSDVRRHFGGRGLFARLDGSKCRASFEDAHANYNAIKPLY